MIAISMGIIGTMITIIRPLILKHNKYKWESWGEKKDKKQ